MLENVPYLCGMTDKDALPQFSGMKVKTLR
jgi:hypothetical protein